MEPISKVQNNKIQLKRLAAQRQMYDKARKFKSYRMVLTIPVAVIWAILSTLFISNGIIILAGGLIIIVIDIFVISNFEKSIQKKAAKTQELFDCEVLQMEWNNNSIGIPPAPEEIAEFALRYNPKKYPDSPLENWYSASIDKLPIHIGRIVCQKSNLIWEVKLRRRYIKGIIICISLLTLLIICGGIFLGLMQLKKYGFIIASLAPVLSFSIMEIHKNRESIDSMNHLKEKMDKLWYDAFIGRVNVEELIRASRDWQNDIYSLRKNNPVIPNWLYKRYRVPDEEKMHRDSAALVEDALRPIEK